MTTVNPQIILLVDDNKTYREGTELVLGLEYQTVLTAKDGAEALRMLQERAASNQPLPAVVLTDNDMPQMNGIALIRALREDPCLQGVGIVLNSAGDDAAIKDALKKNGEGKQPDVVLPKGADIDSELLPTLARVSAIATQRYATITDASLTGQNTTLGVDQANALSG